MQDFLSEAAGAVVLENGAVAFDLAQSKYSISGEYNRCLLHLWSAERNSVRRVLDAEVKNGTLRLAVQRLGQARPSKLEICRERDRRSPTARRVARAAYEQKLRRTLDRHFPEFKVARLTTRRGSGEILWADLCARACAAGALGFRGAWSECAGDAGLDRRGADLRHSVARCLPADHRRVNVLVEGLKMFVPAGTSALVRERMANLNRDAAKWWLFELDERHDALVEIDCADRGNVATRLVHAADDAAARERFKRFDRAGAGDSAELRGRGAIGCGDCLSAGADWSLRKRALGGIPGSFRSTEEIVFGVGAEERVLETSNLELNSMQLAHCLRDTRHPYGPRQHPLWRLRPERWLESLVVGRCERGGRAAGAVVPVFAGSGIFCR